MSMLELLDEDDLTEQPDIYGAKAKYFFQDLVDEAYSIVRVCGVDRKRGDLTRTVDEEYFEMRFAEFLEKCEEERLILKTRSSDPKRKVVWSTDISEFVLIKRALEIVTEMEV